MSPVRLEKDAVPRLFTGLEIPADIALALSRYRGGLPGARWAEPENYHVTLRFIGDIDDGLARDVFSVLGDGRRRGPLGVTLDRLASFGGDRPRALFARIEPAPDLQDLQAEQERLMRRVGLAPEKRKFTPHVTLARLRDTSPRTSPITSPRMAIFRGSPSRPRATSFIRPRNRPGAAPTWSRRRIPLA